MQSVKIFYLVDLNTFKGTNYEENTEIRYCFVNSKNQKIVTNSLRNFLLENHQAFLGFLDGSDCDLRHAFDFKTFLNLNDSVKQFGIEWHQRVKHLVSTTSYQLVNDNKGLKMTVNFADDKHWEEFNERCEEESISHGFKHQVFGSYYDRSEYGIIF
jgi:hypothetical protein|tara:strand:- start:1279 stop:1749 length:471 start_codon:yes stop_codon:yes gene_type:complete